MTVTITVDGTDITDKVRLDGWRIEMAANQGQVGTGRLIIDDTTGSTDYAPLATQWSVTASGATPTTIGGGFVGERSLDKGPLRAGTQRQFGPVLEDWNTVLTDRVLKGSGANRPEETDRQRILWLLGQGVLGMLDGDGIGYVPAGDNVTMDATDYRGKTALDILDDCAESAGKNFYVYHDGSGWKLYYAKTNDTHASFTSSLQVSDDPTDVDSSTCFGPSDVDYEEDPERIYSGLLVKWKSGWVYETLAATETTYRRLQRTVIKENIKSATRAREWAQRQLAKLNEPAKKLELTVSVPESALGQLRAGMRLQVKIRSRGITAFTYFRIAETVISPREGRRGYSDVEYDVRLKMFDKLRPVNLDDTYGGGDSSGNTGTGANVPPSSSVGGSTGGDSGDTNSPTGAASLVDGFTRSNGIAQAGGIATTSNGAATAHAIDIPSEASVAGRLLWVWLSCGYTATMGTQMDDAMSAAGFYGVSGFVSYNGAGGQYAKVYAKMTDGNDAGSVDITLLTSVGVMAIAGVASGATAIEAGGALPNISDQADPPSLDPSWASGDDALWYTVGYIDDAISGDPSGYTNVVSGLTNGTYNVRASYKADDSATEDPSAYTGTATSGFAGGAFTIALADPSAITSALTTSSGTSHEIALPDGLQTGDGLVVFMAYTRETAETLYNEVITPDWPDSAYGQGDGGGSAGQEQIWLWKQLDGTEGFTGADDTFTIDHDVATSNLYAIAVRIPRISMLPIDGFPWNAITSWGETPGSTPTWDTWDISGGYSEWLTTDPCIRFVILSGTGTISDLPTGYTVLSSVDNGTLYFAVAYKDDVSTDSDTPTPDPTLGTGHHVISSFGVRTSGDAAGWGSIPLGEGVDTEAPWVGGNNWNEVWATNGTFTLSGTAGLFTASADGASGQMAVRSEAEDSGSTEPWGPWSDGSMESLWRFKANPLGDLADTSGNRIEFGMYTAAGSNTAVVHLGDAIDYGYMSSNTGLALKSNTSNSFVAKSLIADQYYFLRWDARLDQMRARLWRDGDSEPTTWDVTLAKDYTSPGEYADYLVRVYANSGMVYSFDQWDAVTGSPITGGPVAEILPPGDGSSTTWGIVPWVSGTLRVWVDGIQTLPISVDISAGTFTFDRAPDVGAVIRAEYVAQ